MSILTTRCYRMCVVCVCEDLASLFTYVIGSIDLKLISVCLINDYSLIADLHIFVYGRAVSETISLACRKVKLLILLLDNFELTKHSLQDVYTK